jgi:RimJ/RimL family protein N-acetyltransferase
MPFLVPWTDAIGKPGFVEGFVAYHREQREAWRPGAWHLLLGVSAGGELAGIQGIEGKDFAECRDVNTGSWLGQRFQGRGLGTEMRAAVLEFAFRGLGAETARSGAIAGNVASARVSEKLGYERDEDGVAAPRGEPVCEQRFRLERSRWRAPVPVELEGLEPCLPLFGL